jgi:hypothetical protein
LIRAQKPVESHLDTSNINGGLTNNASMFGAKAAKFSAVTEDKRLLPMFL